MNPLSTPDPAVAKALDALAPAAEPDVEAALRRQRSLEATVRPLPLWRRVAAPRFAAPIAAALLLALSLFTAPVRSLAAQFLTVFRVQNVQPITIDRVSQPVPDLTRLGDMSPNPRQVNLQPTQVNSLAEASSKAGFTVQVPSQLPSGLPSQPSVIAVTNPVTVNFTFRAQKARQYLDDTGHKDISLPAKFDGASLQLQVNPGVSLAYLPAGTSVADLKAAAQAKQQGGQPDSAAIGNLLNGSSVLVLEAKSPVLSASGVSPDELRDFLLSLPNLSADTKAQLRAIGDWNTTLPVPVTPGSSLHKVSINGAPGVAGRNGNMNMVLWVSNGTVFAATGPKVDEQSLITLANSVK